MRFILLILFVFYSCMDQMIPRNDSRLREEKEILFLGEKPFTGEIVSFFEDGKLETSTEYKEGKKNGMEKIWYRNGVILSERNYIDGKKEGIHRGWHEEGQIRFYSQFKNDQFDKESWSWYPDGQVESYAHYENSTLLGYKQWRNDGKIYMNYVLDGTNRIGLYGGRLCKKVEGDNDGKTLSH